MSHHSFFHHVDGMQAKVEPLPLGEWRCLLSIKINGSALKLHLNSPEDAERLGRQILNDSMRIQAESAIQSPIASRANPAPESLA